MIETKRLKIYAASKEEMEAFIAAQSVEVLKAAYTEMLDGCLAHPDQWEWYAVWMIELKDGINEDYCKYCYMNGEFTDKVSMEEYIEMCSQFGAQAGMTNEEMKVYCEKLFPTLKRWK